MSSATNIVLSSFRPGTPQLLLLLGLLQIVIGASAILIYRRSGQSDSVLSSLFCGLVFVLLLLDQLHLPFAQYIHSAVPNTLLVFALVAATCPLLSATSARIFSRCVGTCLFMAVLVGLVRWQLAKSGIILESFGAFLLGALLLGFALFDCDLGTASKKMFVRALVGAVVATFPALLLVLFATRLVDFEGLHPTSTLAVAIAFAVYLGVRIFVPVSVVWRRTAAALVPTALLSFMAADRSGAIWFASGVVSIVAIGGLVTFKLEPVE